MVWAQPGPAPLDPVHDLGPSERRSTVLVGRLLRDLRFFEAGCSGVLAVDWIEGRRGSGRTQVLLSPCLTSPPLQAWQLDPDARADPHDVASLQGAYGRNSSPDRPTFRWRCRGLAGCTPGCPCAGKCAGERSRCSSREPTGLWIIPCIGGVRFSSFGVAWGHPCDHPWTEWCCSFGASRIRPSAFSALGRTATIGGAGGLDGWCCPADS